MKRTAGLMPFFCYYGGKWRAAPKYPTPQFDRVIEPFAGAAGYATRHYERAVTLCDASPTIAGLWQYLTRVPAEEIRRLPVTVGHVDEVRGPPEARWLVGFWLNKATVNPVNKPSSWMRGGLRPNSFWGEAVRDRIAAQVDRIRHSTVVCGTYADLPDAEATWFVDPPYAGACGKLYPCQVADYARLGRWCEERTGQTIVCEQEGADWLPFRPLGVFKAMGGRGNTHSREVIWTGP